MSRLWGTIIDSLLLWAIGISRSSNCISGTKMEALKGSELLAATSRLPKFEVGFWQCWED